MNTENPKADARLPEEALTDIAGGQDISSVNGKYTAPCPACGTMNDPYKTECYMYGVVNHYKCSNCEFEYTISSGA